MANFNIDIPTLNSVMGIPPITCNTNNSYGSYGSSVNSITVEMDIDLLYIIAMGIVRRELSFLNDVQGNLNDLVNSENVEDFNLAMNMMEAQGVKYSTQILRGIKTRDPYTIMNGIRMYNDNNKMNINANRIL